MKKRILVCFVAVLSLAVLVGFKSDELVATVVDFKVSVNDKEVTFENPVVTIDNRTYLPLREVAETLGVDIEWVEETREIKITNNSTGCLYPFVENGLWGYKDCDGNIVVEAKYRRTYEFHEGLGLVENRAGQDRQCGFVNVYGNEAITCQYYGGAHFSEGVTYVSTFDKKLGQRYRYIDKQGNKIFDKEFSAARSFSEGYAAVAKSGYPNSPVPVKWSYIDKSGEFVTELEFDEAYGFSYGHAIVVVGGKYGVINNKFEFVVPCEYDSISGNAQFGFTTILGEEKAWFTISE